MTSVAHPTVFIRKNTIFSLNEFYDENLKQAQDGEYWARLALKGVKFNNLDKVLLKYRIHNDQISIKNENEQKINIYKTKVIFFEKLEIENIKEKIIIHNNLKSGINLNKDEIVYIKNWTNELVEANKKQVFFDCISLKKVISQLWFRVCYNSCNNGLWIYNYYYQNEINKHYRLEVKQKIKFLIRCFFKVNNKKDLIERFRFNVS